MPSDKAQAGLPIIALTQGDPAGIGPEIVLRAAADPSLAKGCRLIVTGNREILTRAAHILSTSKRRNPLHWVKNLEIVEAGRLSPKRVQWGKISAAGGKSSFACVEAGVRLIQTGKADALVTAPISKKAWDLAGLSYPGHTEALAELTGAKDYAMTFFGKGFRVALVTAHLPLKKVAPAIRRRGVLRTLRVVDRWLKEGERKRNPRIAVTGLNPHAGETGMLGTEEEREIRPAVVSAQQEGIRAEGPFPADALFARKGGQWDAVVAMYHDQGLIAAKLLGGGRAVNVTLGLPFIRTSPDHGTAFDIAGQGKADPASLIEAVRLAALLVRQTRRRKPRGG